MKEKSKQIKTKLINSMCQNYGLTKGKSKEVFDDVVASIIEMIKTGESVSLQNLGRFKITHKNEKKGRNPKTGEVVTIKAHDAIHFSASKTLREEINK